MTAKDLIARIAEDLNHGMAETVLAEELVEKIGAGAYDGDSRLLDAAHRCLARLEARIRTREAEALEAATVEDARIAYYAMS